MSTDTLLAISVTLNSAGVVVVALLVAALARRQRRTVDEVTEVQAAVDIILLHNGMSPVFAHRYDVEFVLDPTKVPPPPP